MGATGLIFRGVPLVAQAASPASTHLNTGESRDMNDSNNSEVKKLWLDESKRRLTAYHVRITEAVPADEVFRQAIADLLQMQADQ